MFAITGVEWTSPFPLEVVSTRTVHLRGGITGYEGVLAWEPGPRMAFRINDLSRSGADADADADADAEDYQVTDLGDGTCRLDWPWP